MASDEKKKIGVTTQSTFAGRRCSKVLSSNIFFFVVLFVLFYFKVVSAVWGSTLSPKASNMQCYPAHPPMQVTPRSPTNISSREKEGACLGQSRLTWPSLLNKGRG